MKVLAPSVVRVTLTGNTLMSIGSILSCSIVAVVLGADAGIPRGPGLTLRGRSVFDVFQDGFLPESFLELDNGVRLDLRSKLL